MNRIKQTIAHVNANRRRYIRNAGIAVASTAIVAGGIAAVNHVLNRTDEDDEDDVEVEETPTDTPTDD